MAGHLLVLCSHIENIFRRCSASFGSVCLVETLSPRHRLQWCGIALTGYWEQDISAIFILSDTAIITSCATSCEKRRRIRELILRDTTDYEGPDLGPTISLESNIIYYDII